jgi:asparagine synthase (glutamine-hydrolysing)
MCGINGIIGVRDTLDASLRISRMNNKLVHRGPDAEGAYVVEGIALGHRRLSIIDTSSAGNQPFHSFDGKQTLVFNGEIYNYRELRNELNYPFSTGSDTEVLLAAYRQWGMSFLNKLNGMFAFALWDEEQRQLIIARDRLGIKPLYYCQKGALFAFSSEMRGLLESGLVERKMNTAVIDEYLRYQTVHAPRTILKDVYVLEPGHYILSNDSGLETRKWWGLSENATPVSEDRKENLVDIFNLLQDSVSLRMRADVPFGAFLSGGIDSSAVVGLMASVSTKPIETFSVTFDEKAFSEASYAELIAKRFNTNHNEIRLTADDFMNDVPHALAAMDHPSGDGPNTYVVSKVTKASGVTMALSGLGGDELFAGYPVFGQATDMLSKRWLTSFPKFLRRLAAEGMKLSQPGIAAAKKAEALMLDYFDLEHFYPLSRQTLTDKQTKSLLAQSTLHANPVKKQLIELLDPKGPGFKLPYLSQVSVAEITTYMQNVLLRDTDQMSMAHALEVRVPFLDHRLVSYVLSVSDPHKYPHTPKKLLTDALGTLLPREIIDRPKMGFTLPWDIWMRSTMKSYCEEGLQRLKEHPAFNPQGIQTLWEQFENRNPLVSFSRVWALVVLGHWMKNNRIE